MKIELFIDKRCESMKLTKQHLKQIIAEELRSVLSEQSLRSFLASQGIGDEEMIHWSAVPGWVSLMNMMREFGFERVSSITWKRISEDEEVQLISIKPNDVIFKRTHPDWGFQGGSHVVEYRDFGKAAEEIAVDISPQQTDFGNMFEGKE